MSDTAPILVAAEVVSDATLIQKLLGSEYDNIVVCANPDKTAKIFDKHRPTILILAYHTLQMSEQIYLGLYRQSTIIQSHPHRTLVLCDKDEVHRAYDMCKRDYFDDYIMFWPLTHDAPRLAMAVHHALRELECGGPDAPGIKEFALQARRIAELETHLDKYLVKGKHRLENTSSTLKKAELEIDAAIGKVTRSLAESGDSQRAGLLQEIERIRMDEIGRHLQSVSESLQPVHQWTDSFKEALTPQLESARALRNLADKMRPLVLVVDDDEFQHQLLTQILSEEKLELLFCTTSTKAMTILRKRRPDLILMDINLPDVDGIQITRHIKSIDYFADIPIIMITGQSNKNVVVDSMNAGVTDFVVKPFEKNSLIEKIYHSLNH